MEKQDEAVLPFIICYYVCPSIDEPVPGRPCEYGAAGTPAGKVIVSTKQGAETILPHCAWERPDIRTSVELELYTINSFASS